MLHPNRLLLCPVLAGALLGSSACTWNGFYADTSTALQAVVGFEGQPGQVPLRVVVEDLDQDGLKDVAVLLGQHGGYGYGTYDMQQMAAAEALVVLLGDGRGGMQEVSRVPVSLGSPLDLKVWKPAAGATPMLALYGVQDGTDVYASGGVPELGLFSVDATGLQQRAAHAFTSLPYGARVDLGFIPGATPGSSKLLLAQPATMDATRTTAGTPVTASVLASPEGEGFSDEGLVANNPHGSYDVFTVVDLNEDGRMDTVLTDSCVYNVSLQFSQPDGSVVAGPVTPLPLQEIPIAAFPHRNPADARPRVLLVSQSAVALYRQENDALVVEEVTRVMGQTVGAIQTDLNADGIADLFVTSSDGHVALLILDQDGRVSERRIKNVEVVARADQEVGPTPSNVAQGTVDRLNPAPRGVQVSSALTGAAGDLNGDGHPDLILGSTDGRILIHVAD